MSSHQTCFQPLDLNLSRLHLPEFLPKLPEESWKRDFVDLSEPLSLFHQEDFDAFIEMGQVKSCLVGSHVEDGVIYMRHIPVHNPTVHKKELQSHQEPVYHHLLNRNKTESDDDDDSIVARNEMRSATTRGTSNNNKLEKIENKRVGINMSSEFSFRHGKPTFHPHAWNHTVLCN